MSLPLIAGSPNNSKNLVPNSANSFSLLFRGSMAATTLSLSLHLIFNLTGIKYNIVSRSINRLMDGRH